MRAAGCNRLVFSSSGAVYGNADSKALPEDYPCAPINPYGASKWMIERVLADYRGAYGLGSFALRYFNASGADPSGDIGEMREVETRLIPRAMMALQGHVPDFAVFGDDYPTPDGTAIRDYIHVTDLAAAHVLALKLLLGGHTGGALNLGCRNLGNKAHPGILANGGDSCHSCGLVRERLGECHNCSVRSSQLKSEGIVRVGE